MTTARNAELAQELLVAAAQRTTVAPLRDRVADMTLDDAYEIQSRQLDAHLAEGRSLVGRKIGLTSLAMQEQLGVDSPDFGFVLDTMVFSDGDTVNIDQFIAPRAEPELAFVLSSPLQGPGVTRDDAVNAVSDVFAAIEIIDSRVENWNIGLLDTVADNASCGAIVVGREPLSVLPGATAAVEVELQINGDRVEGGRGDAVLGDPIAPLVWLANLLGERGVTLNAGEIILTGSFCRAAAIAEGDRVIADFGPLGALSVAFERNNS